MDNKVLEDIKKYAVQRLTGAYGYCGVADAQNMAMLNSGEQGENITINIKYEKDEGQ